MACSAGSHSEDPQSAGRQTEGGEDSLRSPYCGLRRKGKTRQGEQAWDWPVRIISAGTALSTLVYYPALGRSGQKGGDLEYKSLMRRWLRGLALDWLVCTQKLPFRRSPALSLGTGPPREGQAFQGQPGPSCPNIRKHRRQPGVSNTLSTPPSRVRGC